MLVMGAPQFETQDDFGFGSGISPTPQWHLASLGQEFDDSPLNDRNIDPAIRNVLTRLHNIFQLSGPSPLSSAELHDLTCFVMHKVLLLPPLSPTDSTRSAISECLRHAISLYMLIIHGMTYYSHVGLVNTIMFQLKDHLEALAQTEYIHGPLGIWIFSVCMVTADTMRTNGRPWFMSQACTAARALNLTTGDEVLAHLKSVLWIETHGDVFRRQWDDVFSVMPG